jgi:hypothetical protein
MWVPVALGARVARVSQDAREESELKKKVNLG